MVDSAVGNGGQMGQIVMDGIGLQFRVSGDGDVFRNALGKGNIKKSYALLGLISYLTAGEKETRAWTIVKGTKAPQAAGKIHTDFEKGFIRAEICDWQTLLDCNGLVGAREKGKVRSEGKEYVIKDGDVVLFRFNV